MDGQTNELWVIKNSHPLPYDTSLCKMNGPFNVSFKITVNKYVGLWHDINPNIIFFSFAFVLELRTWNTVFRDSTLWPNSLILCYFNLLWVDPQLSTEQVFVGDRKKVIKTGHWGLRAAHSGWRDRIRTCGVRGLQGCNYCTGMLEASPADRTCVLCLSSSRHTPVQPPLAPEIHCKITKDWTSWDSACYLFWSHLSYLERHFRIEVDEPWGGWGRTLTSQACPAAKLERPADIWSQALSRYSVRTSWLAMHRLVKETAWGLSPRRSIWAEPRAKL